MVYTFSSIIAIVIALLISLWAFKVLFKSNWVMGWFRGTWGILLIASVAFLLVAAFDIISYRQLEAEESIATISFRKINKQHYMATLVTSAGKVREYPLYGDQWQLDSRIIKWPSRLVRFGAKTGYRLERLSGRYISLEDEQSKPKKLYALNTSIAGVDIWMWLNQLSHNGFVDARYGNATFLPMVDSGQYQISLSNTGLLARPLNEPAEQAVARWQ